METITLADYIQYGFMAFICLLLITLVAGMFRQFRDSGETHGRLSGLEKQLSDLAGRVANLEQNMMTLTGEVGEVKGLVRALHQKVDLLMRHRHDADTGQVILTPGEIAAD